MVDPNSIKESFPMNEPTEWKEVTFPTKPDRFVRINDDTYMQIENVKVHYTGQIIETWYPTHEKKPEVFYTANTRWIPTALYNSIVNETISKSSLESLEYQKEISEKLDVTMLAIADLYEKMSQK